MQALLKMATNITYRQHTYKPAACIFLLSFVLVPVSCNHVSVPLGNIALLPCRVDQINSDPATMVAWTDPKGEFLSYNEDIIKSGDPRFAIIKPFHYDYNLQVKNVKKADEGLYTCKVMHNGKEFFKQNSQLQVLIPPQVKTSNESKLSVTEGSNLLLICISTGVPDPQVNWKFHKNGSEVEEVIMMRDPSHFSVQNITLRQSGHYECQADNGVPPIASNHFFVEVLSAPHVHVPYMKVVQRTGQYVYLQCIVTWNPKGTIQWEFDRRMISHSYEKSQDSALDKYITSVQIIDTYVSSVGLFVYNFGEHDGGVYKCTTNNSQGFAQGFIEVTAYHNPDASANIDVPRNEYAPPGSDFILTCRIKGSESSRPVTWLKHTSTMKDFEAIPIHPPGKKYQLIKGRDLEIISVNKSDQGYYMCSAGSNSTLYFTVTADFLASSVDYNQKTVKLTTAFGIGGSMIFVLCCLFLAAILILRAQYRKQLVISREPTLGGPRLITSHKL